MEQKEIGDLESSVRGVVLSAKLLQMQDIQNQKIIKNLRTPKKQENYKNGKYLIVSLS